MVIEALGLRKDEKMSRRPFVTKAQQIASARRKIATFYANEGNPVPDYITPEEKARKAVRIKIPTLEEIEARLKD